MVRALLQSAWVKGVAYAGLAALCAAAAFAGAAPPSGPPGAPAKAPPKKKPPQILYIQAGEVRPVSVRPIRDGVVIVTDDKITAVGGPFLEAPAGARILRFPDKVLVPGFIDAASGVLAIGDEWSRLGDSDPARSAMDGLDPFDERWKDAVAEGVTAAYVSMGPTGTITGTGAVIRLSGGMFARELAVLPRAHVEGALCPAASSYTPAARGSSRVLWDEDDYSGEGQGEPAALESSEGGVDGTDSPDGADRADARTDIDDDVEIIILQGWMTGTAPRRRVSGFDLLGGYVSLRQYLEQARAYQRVRTWYEQDLGAWERTVARMRKEHEEARARGATAPPPSLPPKPSEPSPDAVGEALLPVLEGKVRLRVWAERVEEIHLVLKLAQEYGVRLVLCGALEGHLAAEDIARAGAQVVLLPVGESAGLGPDVRISRANARALFDAGVQCGIGTGAPPSASARLLRHFAAQEVGRGLDAEYVLRMLTLTNAEILGVADRLGSITEGKEANLVVFDGPPFGTASKVLLTVVGGKIVYEEGEKKPAPDDAERGAQESTPDNERNE